jgi:hypothetical protein
MSYFDKVRKREAKRKLAEEVMNTPEFKEAMRQQNEQAILNALGRFTFMMCGYLETKHRYGKLGLLRFMHFVKMGLKEMDDNENFFVGYNEHYIEEYGLDVLAELWLGLEENTK